jgi:hypothetical protein
MFGLRVFADDRNRKLAGENLLTVSIKMLRNAQVVGS